VQILLDVKEYEFDLSDKLQLQITDSHIIVATTQNELVDSKCKSSIMLMKVPIAEM
jgi:hypothetical protein